MSNATWDPSLMHEEFAYHNDNHLIINGLCEDHECMEAFSDCASNYYDALFSDDSDDDTFSPSPTPSHAHELMVDSLILSPRIHHDICLT